MDCFVAGAPRNDDERGMRGCFREFGTDRQNESFLRGHPFETAAAMLVSEQLDKNLD
jgi:hypothetical protein